MSEGLKGKLSLLCGADFERSVWDWRGDFLAPSFCLTHNLTHTRKNCVETLE